MYGETEVQTAERLFREALPLATAQICHLSLYGATDRIKLEASKYIVERNLGLLRDVEAHRSEDPLMQLLKEINTKAVANG
jgi:hypothetical protein